MADTTTTTIRRGPVLAQATGSYNDGERWLIHQIHCKEPPDPEAPYLVRWIEHAQAFLVRCADIREEWCATRLEAQSRFLACQRAAFDGRRISVLRAQDDDAALLELVRGGGRPTWGDVLQELGDPQAVSASVNRLEDAARVGAEGLRYVVPNAPPAGQFVPFYEHVPARLGSEASAPTTYQEEGAR